MSKLGMVLFVLLIHSSVGEDPLWLSRVSPGDCVAARLFAKRSKFEKEWEKQDCRMKNSDKKLAAKCVENAKLDEAADVEFFTDRCSEKEYFIGVNGKVHRLRKVSPNRKPHLFIGAFAGDGLRVEISEPRLLSKAYEPGQPRTEEHLTDTEYAVRVGVKRGRFQKTFKATLWYGR